MSAIKLTYFNIRARGEPARLLLALAGKKYERSIKMKTSSCGMKYRIWCMKMLLHIPQIKSCAMKRYEDKRLPTPWEDFKTWKAEKPLTPWGTVPVLNYDGLVIGQSTAANRLNKAMTNTMYD